MKVRSDMEPLEQQEMAETSPPKEQGSMLEDGDYSEAEKIKGEDQYGDKYNSKFVQELLALRKTEEKAK